MQVEAREFVDHYPKHAEWLDAVIGEMNEGVRVAYGVFLPRFHGRGGEITQELVGSIIIKKGQYSKVVEMKNLYMSPTERNKAYGKALYNEVENYCRRKGYRIIETEVPCGEIDTITVLHKWGFTATKRLDSRFRKNDQIYVMEKKIRPAYAGDPFDYRAICEWYVEERWGFSLKQRDDGFSLYTTRGLSETDADLSSPTMAVVTSLDPRRSDIIQKASNSAELVFDFVGDDSHKGAQSVGIKKVSFDQVLESIENDFGYIRPDFSKEEIGGLIVSFNPEIIANLRKRLGEDAPYYKGGPVGRFVKNGHTALLFSEGGKHLKYGGIVGFGKVRQVKHDEPANVLTELKDLANPLIDDAHYSMLFASKKSVIGFILSDLKMIEPMEKDQIEAFLGELTEVEMSEIGHRYISQSELADFLELSNEITNGEAADARTGTKSVSSSSPGGTVNFSDGA